MKFNFFVVFLCLALSGCQCSDAVEAKRAAIEFAKHVPGATGDVSCTQTDTNQDGYCNCSIFKHDGTALTVDCGCEKYCFNCARGCKIVDNVKLIGK